MKTLITYSLILTLIPSCANIKGNGWQFTTVGTDTKGFSVTADGMQFDDMNQSIAFKETTKLVNLMWKSYIMGKLLQYVSGKYYDHQGKIVNQETTVKLEKLRNADSAADAKAALETLKETNRAAEALTVIPKA